MVFPVAWMDGRVGEDDRLGVPSAEFTVTRSVPDVAEVGVVALSVTL